LKGIAAMPAPQKLLPLKLSVEQPRRGVGRWAGALVLIVGIHVSGAAIGMMQWEGPMDVPAPLPPAILIDLQPIAAAPPPLPPPTAAPAVTEAEVELPDLAELVPVEPEVELPPLTELDDLPPPPPEVTPAVELPKKETKKDKKKDEQKTEKKAKKKPEEIVQKKEKVEQKIVAKTTGELQTKEFKTASATPSKTTVEVPKAQQSAAVPAGPTASDLAAIAAAQASWESRVVAHLSNHKKYPRAAKRRNHMGTPLVAFVIDRAGYVKEAYLVSSSGYESLDEEALATIRRAEPLPAVPAEIAGATIARKVPIDFTLTDN
jgi:protein TonB